MKMREGEGGKSSASKVSKGKPEIILCRDMGQVMCFLSVNNGHLKTCGTPGMDWRYGSPKSIVLWSEGRNSKAGAIIENAQFLAKMTGFKLRDELMSCDIRKNNR